MIKTSNKLIGEIENKDLYNSDEENDCPNHFDDPLNFSKGLDTEMSFRRDDELDLG